MRATSASSSAKPAIHAPLSWPWCSGGQEATIYPGRMPVIETPAGARVPGDDEAPGLSERDRAMLAFEREWWKLPGAKEAAIKERFGMSATQYYQQLSALADTAEALAADPLLVKRIQRRRASRRRTS